MDVKIKMLGIGAVCLFTSMKRLFIDAFNEYTTESSLESSDILLFTHDDKDHFLAEEVLKHYKDNTIIGPPSIAYPLLRDGNINPQKLMILYPPQRYQPMTFVIDDIEISAYQTSHFMDWNPIHLSYRIEFSGKKIFFTGDSHLDHTTPEMYQNIDVLIYSLIYEEIVKGRMSSETGAAIHLGELVDILHRYHPNKIICNHVKNCSWAVQPEDMKNCLIRNMIQNILVPINEEIIV